MAGVTRALLAAVLALLFTGCGTFGDDFDDVKPEETSGPGDGDRNDADAGVDASDELSLHGTTPTSLK